jgi:hypothetical protein
MVPGTPYEPDLNKYPTALAKIAKVKLQPKKFKTVGTLKEARAFAKELGLEKVVYPEGTLQVANEVNRALEGVIEKTKFIPKGVVITKKFETLFGGGLASFSSKDEMIYINANEDFWKEVAGNTKTGHSDHFWSSPHEFHWLYHEFGHNLHFKNDPKGFKKVKDTFPVSMQTIIESEVSEYAAFNKGELVAEIHAGVIAGFIDYAQLNEFIRIEFESLGGVLP